MHAIKHNVGVFLSRGQSRTFTSEAPNVIRDTFGRQHDYLRLSLTERCNFRCRYCMPEDGIKLTEAKQCLTIDELKRISNIFVKLCGVRKIRLTGGEPTIDGKLLPLMEHLNDLKTSGLQTIALTTNGTKLKKLAKTYRDSGLNAVNISLDTLRPDRFEFITRRMGLKLVLEGLDSALRVGFESVKLNCVVMKDFNSDEIVDFARLAVKYPVEVRFIEFMPFAGNKWTLDQMIPYKDVLAIISEQVSGIERHPGISDSETSKIYKSPAMQGSIGFISSISDNFCSGCNRIRVTSDGNIKVCLFDRKETSLRDLMRYGASDNEIRSAIVKALSKKKRQHAARRSFHSTSGNEKDDTSNFSHLDSKGQVKMVNIKDKKVIRRIAVAQGKIHVGKDVLSQVSNIVNRKGDILTVSKVAGIMGAKSTSTLIPLCHGIPLEHIDIEISPCKESASLVVRAQVEARHSTGVEMESLTAVSITLLTIYDMCKSVNKSLVISDVRLISKEKIP